jgi:hypothetical protein
VDDELGACHEGCLVGSEKQHNPRDLLRVPVRFIGEIDGIESIWSRVRI